MSGVEAERPARVFLPEIVQHRRAAVARLCAETPLAEIARRAAAVVRRPRPFGPALRAAGPGHLAVIAELKRVSPASGPLAPGLEPAAVAAAYARGGAAALSVLTEPEFFRARPGDLPAAREASGLPTLRKDFVVDPWQLHETVLLGADAVLLLVVVLGPRTAEFVDLSLDLGLEPFVEVHTAQELEIALGTRASVLGINNRDLTSFAVDATTAARLAPRAAGRTVAALSGIRGPADLRGLRAAGIHAVLVGEALVRAGDAEGAVRALAEATA